MDSVEIIRKYMEVNRVSYREMSKRIGTNRVSPATLWRVCNGINKPTQKCAYWLNRYVAELEYSQPTSITKEPDEIAKIKNTIDKILVEIKYLRVAMGLLSSYQQEFLNTLITAWGLERTAKDISVTVSQLSRAIHLGRTTPIIYQKIDQYILFMNKRCSKGQNDVSGTPQPQKDT